VFHVVLRGARRYHQPGGRLPAEQLAGKVVRDTINYYPYRDSRIAELDSEQTTTSELVQAHLVDAHVVKPFNNILAHRIPVLARPAGADDRSALPIAGDDARAKEIAASLIDKLDFNTVDAGTLAQGWRFEPETPAYTPAYAADPASLAENLRTDPGIALSADSLRALLADAHRPPVADREF
jgi:predicted dinucleotide-binding enzyme